MENFYERNKRRLFEAMTGAKSRIDSDKIKRAISSALVKSGDQKKQEPLNKEPLSKIQQDRQQLYKSQQLASQQMLKARSIVDQQREQQRQVLQVHRQRTEQAQKQQEQQRSNVIKQQIQQRELYAKQARMDSSKKAPDFKKQYAELKQAKDSQFTKKFQLEQDPKRKEELSREREYRQKAMNSDTFKSMANRSIKQTDRIKELESKSVKTNSDMKEIKNGKTLDSKMDRYIDLKSYQDYKKDKALTNQTSEKTAAQGQQKKEEWRKSKDGKIEYSMDDMRYRKKNELGNTDYYQRNKSGDFEFDHVATSRMRAEQYMSAMKAREENKTRKEEILGADKLQQKTSQDKKSKVIDDPRVRDRSEKDDAVKAHSKLEKHREKVSKQTTPGEKQPGNELATNNSKRKPGQLNEREGVKFARQLERNEHRQQANGNQSGKETPKSSERLPDDKSRRPTPPPAGDVRPTVKQELTKEDIKMMEKAKQDKPLREERNVNRQNEAKEAKQSSGASFGGDEQNPHKRRQR